MIKKFSSHEKEFLFMLSNAMGYYIESGKTQGQLASHLGLKKSTVQRYLNKTPKTLPIPETSYKILSKLKTEDETSGYMSLIYPEWWKTFGKDYNTNIENLQDKIPEQIKYSFNKRHLKIFFRANAPGGVSTKWIAEHLGKSAIIEEAEELCKIGLLKNHESHYSLNSENDIRLPLEVTISMMKAMTSNFPCDSNEIRNGQSRMEMGTLSKEDLPKFREMIKKHSSELMNFISECDSSDSLKEFIVYSSMLNIWEPI